MKELTRKREIIKKEEKVQLFTIHESRSQPIPFSSYQIHPPRKFIDFQTVFIQNFSGNILTFILFEELVTPLDIKFLQ